MADIELEYGFLEEGVTLSGQVCPRCEGGASRERSFNVTKKDGVLLWKCHRASCNESGSTKSNSSLYSGHRGVGGGQSGQYSSAENDSGPGRSAVTRKPRTMPLSGEDLGLLKARYNFTEQEIERGNLKWTTEHSPVGAGRVVMPVMDLDGTYSGYVARALDNQKPKALSYTTKLAMGWYINTESSILIIVEDMLSALRLSSFVSSVALLGTNLSEARLRKIKEAKFRSTYLALDNDAYLKSAKLVKRYTLQFPGLALLSITKDFKDMTRDNLYERLQELLRHASSSSKFSD